MRIPEDIEMIDASLGVAEPGLKSGRKCIACQWPPSTGINDVKVVFGESFSYLRKTLCGYTNFNVVVRPSLSAHKEIERPAGDDVPSRAGFRKTRRDFFGSPGLPGNILSEQFTFEGRLRIHRAILSALVINLQCLVVDLSRRVVEVIV